LEILGLGVIWVMSEILNRYPALRKAPLLKGLKDVHLTGLLGVMKERRLEAEEVLFKQGQGGDSMAIIASGALRITIRTPDGGETEVRVLEPGDVVGELACVDPAPRSATVTAVVSSAVFFMNRRMLLALRQKGPLVARALVGGIINQVTERIRVVNSSLEERLSRMGRIRQHLVSSRPPFPEADKLASQAVSEPIDLGKVEAFKEFTPNERETLVAVSRHRRYPAGSLLCREGDSGDSCFIIVDGDVEVHKQVDGEPKYLTALSGCLLGQMALVDPSPRSATLRIRDEVLTLELTRDTFEQLLNQQNSFAIRFQDLLAVTGIRQLREATDRLAKESAPVKRPAPPPPEKVAVRIPAEEPSSGRPSPYRAGPSGRAAPPASGSFVKAGSKDSLWPDDPPVASRSDEARDLEESMRARLKSRSQRPPAQPSGRRTVDRKKLERIQPKNEKEAAQLTTAYMAASLSEWGMSMQDLDEIKVSRPEGMMSAAEKKTRGIF
jgi:CRP-like cAMP-binding protein